MALQPLIGITTAVAINPQSGPGARFLTAYEQNLIAIERAGGLPVMLPATLDAATLRALYERVDALLIPGGGDVEPAIYGAQAHPETKFVDPERDQAEISVIRWAAEEDKPLFGICRGHQVINVALGGTLTQDIPSELDTTIAHDFARDIARNYIAHSVEITADSVLANLVGDTRLDVNSLHHQAILNPATPLKLTAYAPDGIIEGTELPDHPFFISVQWHPEDLIDHPIMQGLFNALVDAARSNV